jgi:TRAP-type C4-dicarboxylate transport system permease large subunit
MTKRLQALGVVEARLVSANRWLVIALMAAMAVLVFAMVIAGIAAILVQGTIDPMVAVQTMFAAIDSFPLLAIPFFILAAELLSGGALTEVLLRFAAQLVIATTGQCVIGPC